MPVSFIKSGFSRKAEAYIQLMYLKIIIKKLMYDQKQPGSNPPKYFTNILEILWKLYDILSQFMLLPTIERKISEMFYSQL